ncbi:MAG: Dam family site-specific DNA-(adenine-N6)-methyltransferase [Thermomicrobiales bacterium]
MQLALFENRMDADVPLVSRISPFKMQLLKWIGNKQRFAYEIANYLPTTFGTYFEPFLGSGAVLATLAPRDAEASDTLMPLVEIWQALSATPDLLTQWYADRYAHFLSGDRVAMYEQIKASYNARPNGADLLFLSRSCYGGVVRFRQADGYMSTPVGVHDPISPDSFRRRVDLWHERTKNARFLNSDFEPVMEMAQAGDVVYCDPPYSYSQTIVYGAQGFSLPRLLRAITRCKERGVSVALSIDGTKRSGNMLCDIPIPEGLFEHEVTVNCGRSMLRRFQMGGATLEGEVVKDRLLLTY